MVQAAILMVFPLCLAVAAISDLLTMTIPNRVSAILLASFLIVAPLAGLSPQGIALHLMAGLVVFSVCFSLFAMNVMGGGDAKLLTAAAVWFGWNQALMLFVEGLPHLVLRAVGLGDVGLRAGSCSTGFRCWPPIWRSS